MCGGRVQRKTSQNSQINEIRQKKNMRKRERSENEWRTGQVSVC